jgi:Isopentenyldiphosphate isomerase
MEMLDIIDEKGNPTGEIIDRSIAHLNGIRHRTAHVWILRKKNNRIQVLLQKRSVHKDSYPDCYDISSAGHILAGCDYIESALRELKEELGVSVREDELVFAGIRNLEYKDVFHHQVFHDVEVSYIYVLEMDREDFVLQKEEVSEVQWFDFDECYQMVINNTFKHCIYTEELDIVKEGIKQLNFF